MRLTQRKAIAITGRITERKEFGTAVNPVEQQRARLLRTTPGTLTRRHDPDGTEGP